MRKLTMGLYTLIVCFMFTSCDLLGISQSPAKKIEKLAEDINEHAEEWDVDQWTDAQRTFLEAVIDFGNSNPNQKDFDEFSDAAESFVEALADLENSDKAEKIISKIEKASTKLKKEIKNDKDLIKRAKSAVKNYEKILEKYGTEEDLQVFHFFTSSYDL